MGTSLICCFSFFWWILGWWIEWFHEIRVRTLCRKVKKWDGAYLYWVAFICVMQEKKKNHFRETFYSYIYLESSTHKHIRAHAHAHARRQTHAKTHARIINNQLHASQTYLYYYLFFFFPNTHAPPPPAYSVHTYKCIMHTPDVWVLKNYMYKNKHTMAAWISRRRTNKKKKNVYRRLWNWVWWRPSSCRH